MQVIIKIEVDSKLDKEMTKQLIYDSIKSWIADNDGFFPVAQDHDYDDEQVIELDSIIVT